MPYKKMKKYKVNLLKVNVKDSIKTLDEAINLLSLRATYTGDAILWGMNIAISELKEMKKQIHNIKN